MKKLSTILKQKPVFLNDWNSKEQVLADFDVKEKQADANILFASYTAANYSGDAWVLSEKDGELWETNGGHCSCYGLEGQWDTERVVLAELKNRITKGDLGKGGYSENEFRTELANFLGIKL